MSKVAFERIVKKLHQARRARRRRAIAEGTAEFGALTAILDAALARPRVRRGPLSLADFALAAHYSLAAACGLDVAPFRARRQRGSRACSLAIA